jgi:hypothetical protein
MVEEGPKINRSSVFLTAEWRYLAMLNYEIDPAVLRPYVPEGTELDAFEGRYFVSMVGFLFLNTRVLRVPIPFHRDFEEVNLRFYVRRKAAGEWRRGVVFVKELVPRRAIAWTARALYGENYEAVPMTHAIQTDSDGSMGGVEYSWRFAGRENRIALSVSGEPRDIAEGSQEEFITEHYWGYARRRRRSTVEYEVEHPRWRVWSATDAKFECDIPALYGASFVEALDGPPTSSFLAEGSKVAVYRGTRLIVP